MTNYKPRKVLYVALLKYIHHDNVKVSNFWKPSLLFGVSGVITCTS